MNSIVLVIDVQNSYYARNGIMRSVLGDLLLPDLVQRLNTVGPVLRDIGPQWWTRHCYDADYADAPLEWRERMTAVMARDGLVRGTWDAALAEGLAVGPDDLVMDKVQYDAFAGTGLADLLDDAGVDDLYLAGSLTNVCVAATARSARRLGLRTTVLTDLVTARDEVAHVEALSELDTVGVRLVASSELPPVAQSELPQGGRVSAPTSANGGRS